MYGSSRRRTSADFVHADRALEGATKDRAPVSADEGPSPCHGGLGDGFIVVADLGGGEERLFWGAGA